MNHGVRLSMARIFALLLSTLLVMAGCGSRTSAPPEPPTSAPEPGKPAPRPAVGGTYVYTTIGDAQVLLPVLSADGASSFVNFFLYDTMFSFDDKLNLHPNIAESMSIENDVVYTFKLKPGLKFHDGQPLTSADVAFTFLSIAHPKYQGVRFGDFTGIKGWADLSKTYTTLNTEVKENKIDQATADARKLEAWERFVREGGIATPDPLIFRVELTEPFAPMTVRLAASYGIMPKHLLEKHLNDMKAAPQARAPVGSGPYKFVEWVKDSHVILVRNPDWKGWVSQSPTHIERMIIRTIADSQANMIALETLETDFAVIDPDMYQHFLQKVPHVNVLTGETFTYTFMGYNLKHQFFEDARVRKAITQAVNRQEIVDQILLGHGAVAHSHASRVRWDYNPNVPQFNFDVAKAEALLDEAGWRKGPDGIRAKDGQKFIMELATNNGNKIREQAAVIIQQALKRVGIEVKVNLMEWNAFLDHIGSEKKQAYIVAWGLGIDPDAHSIFHSAGGFHRFSYYSNPRVDSLIEQGRRVTDQSKRAEIYGEMQKILAEDQVYTWLFFQKSIAGINKRIKGTPTEITPAGSHWNFERWHISVVQ
jgi:peptide/nickel transport system substrate-binding protein